MEALISGLGREPRQRTTLYAAVPPSRRRQSFGAAPLKPVVQTPLVHAGRHAASRA
jgi:hypothetical protein